MTWQEIIVAAAGIVTLLAIVRAVVSAIKNRRNPCGNCPCTCKNADKSECEHNKRLS